MVKDITTHLPKGNIFSMTQETLAIQLYAEHRATKSTVSWFELTHNQRERYRNMAIGAYKLPTARKKR